MNLVPRGRTCPSHSCLQSFRGTTVPRLRDFDSATWALTAALIQEGGFLLRDGRKCCFIQRRRYWLKQKSIYPSTFAEQTSMRPAKYKSWQQTRAGLKGPGWGVEGPWFWQPQGVAGGSAPSPDDTAAGSSREPREEGQYSLLGVQGGPWGIVVWIRRWCLDHGKRGPGLP